MFRVVPLLAAIGAALALNACSGSRQEPPRLYALGDKVTVGHMVYTVFETKWETQLHQEPSPRVPRNRFFLVRLNVVNGAGGDVIVPDMTLEDDNGESYPALNNGEGVPMWLGSLRKVAPAEAANGIVAFDVPPKHYKLRVTDENGDTAALIDIPLSFNSEAPNLAPVPNAAR